MLVQIRVFRDEDGVWCASGVDHGIHTQGATLDELYANIDEAAQLHFEEELAAGKTIDVLILSQRELARARGGIIGQEIGGCPAGLRLGSLPA